MNILTQKAMDAQTRYQKALDRRGEVKRLLEYGYHPELVDELESLDLEVIPELAREADEELDRLHKVKDSKCRCGDSHLAHSLAGCLLCKCQKYRRSS